MTVSIPHTTPAPGPDPAPAAPPIIADVHAHTSHSHGQAGVHEMVHSAAQKGLKIFGLSEHSPRPRGFEYPTDYQEKLKAGFADYVREVQEAAAAWKERGLTVLLGLEVDYIPAREHYAYGLINSWPFDFLIGGLHFQGPWGFDFTADDWAPLGRDERFAIYERYYDDLASMCDSGLFHIAAHPDLVKLFTVDTFKVWLTTVPGRYLTKQALTAMKDNNVLMEISSAGLRKPCNEIYPGPELMALARDMELPISFASDAHCTATPAHAFDLLARYAAGFGYKEHHYVAGGERHTLSFEAPPSLSSNRTASS